MVLRFRCLEAGTVLRPMHEVAVLEDPEVVRARNDHGRDRSHGVGRHCSCRLLCSRPLITERFENRCAAETIGLKQTIRKGYVLSNVLAARKRSAEVSGHVATDRHR